MEDFSNHKEFLTNTPHDEDANMNDEFIFDGDGNIIVEDMEHVSDVLSVAALQRKEVLNGYTPEDIGHHSVYPSCDILLAWMDARPTRYYETTT